ncbi:hypothetical protein OAO94_02200 [Flavobacteriaceae bacterium]|nr:hypothetical protein [Flavobacteriaceae bacterium]
MKKLLILQAIFLFITSTSISQNLESLVNSNKYDSKYDIQRIYKEKDIFMSSTLTDYYRSDYKLEEMKAYLEKVYKKVDSLSTQKRKERVKNAYDYVIENSIWEHPSGEEYNRYDDNIAISARLAIIRHLEKKYKNNSELSDDELFNILDENDLRPYSKWSGKKNVFAAGFLVKSENRKKGIKYNRDVLFSNLNKIFTKQKILNFYRLNKINNNSYFENQNMIEKYAICQNCFKMVNPFGKEVKVDFNIVFTNKSINKYVDQKNYNIIIMPDDLKNINDSYNSEAEIVQNILKTANYIVNQLADNLEIKNDKGSEFYMTDGNKKANLGDFTGAIQSYDKGILIDKSSPDLYRLRGFVKKRAKDYKGAIVDLTTALELTVEGSEYDIWIENILTEMAFCKVFTDDAYGAIFDCIKAIKINPNSAEAFGIRGIAKTMVNDISGACSDGKKAAELGNTKYIETLRPFCN